jgi:hypothetical protein
VKALPTVYHHYLAPDCYTDEYDRKIDVFPFGLILYEIVVGRPGLPRFFEKPRLQKYLSMDKLRLIIDCRVDGPDNRPTFEDIHEFLQEMACGSLATRSM